MVGREVVDGRHGVRVPVGVFGAAPMFCDASSGRGACRRRPYANQANEVPRDCEPPGTGDVLSGLPATEELCTFVLRRMALDVPLR